MFRSKLPDTRVITFNRKKSKTKQEPKDDCDINRIVNHYVKYGVVPDDISIKTGKSFDCSVVPDFQGAQNIVRQAQETFAEMPLEIRRLCDHDPIKVMEFLYDPKNSDMLKKHGLLREEIIEKPDPIEILEKIAENTAKEPAQLLT